MPKILNQIKSRLKKIYLKPVCDDIVYEDNWQSYCGGSLAYSNILVVAHSVGSEVLEGIGQIAAIERFHLSVIDSMAVGSVHDIEKASAELLGPYAHIINIFDFTGRQFDGPEAAHIYHIFQQEISYLIDCEVHGTVCSIIRMDEDRSVNAVKIRGFASIIEGLGEPFPNHGCLENGILSSSATPVRTAFEMALFLSGKYGNILNGELIEMK